MSVCVVLAQFDSLVTRMESLSSKLSTKRIRPTRDQLNDFQNLHTRLKAALADYDAGIEKLLAAGYPNEKDICIADRVRSAKDSGPITSPTLTIFKRNMALIFMGPKTSNLDSNQVKTKNKQIEMRCEILRSQNIHILIMWAMTLQPSTWKTSGGMTDMTFSFLIKDLQDERMNRIPRKISETIQSLAEEEPLKSSGFFKAFVEIVSKTELDQEHAAGIQPPLKRKRIEQISSEYESAGISGRRETSANTELCMNQHAASDIPKIQQSRRKSKILRDIYKGANGLKKLTTDAQHRLSQSYQL